MFTYPIHTVVHCNRCDKPFELQRKRAGTEMDAHSVARLQEFETCPYCGMTDCHYVYARDYLSAMPPAIFAVRLTCNLQVAGNIIIGAGTTLDVKQIYGNETHNGQPTVLVSHNDLEFYVRGWEYTTDLTRSTTEIAAATQQRIEARIQCGYKEWIANPLRARSGEVDSGCWWTLHGDAKEFPHWRVSFIQDTGDLYACAERADKYILLANTQPKDEARSEFLLDGWADFDGPIHNNLTALLEQIQARTSEPTPQTFIEKFKRRKEGR